MFSTGNPDGRIGTLSRPNLGPGLIETERDGGFAESVGKMLTRRQVRLLKGQIDDRRFDLVRDLVPDSPRSRLAILQSFDPALLVSARPVVERRSRDPGWSQCPGDCRR